MKALDERLRRTPFPRLGKSVEDFPAFDAVLAGLASRASRGERVESVGPHMGALQTCEFLRRKIAVSDDELIAYVDLLEMIRVRITKEDHRH